MLMCRLLILPFFVDISAVDDTADVVVAVVLVIDSVVLALLVLVLLVVNHQQLSPLPVQLNQCARMPPTPRPNVLVWSTRYYLSCVVLYCVCMFSPAKRTTLPTSDQLTAPCSRIRKMFYLLLLGSLLPFVSFDRVTLSPVYTHLFTLRSNKIDIARARAALF